MHSVECLIFILHQYNCIVTVITQKLSREQSKRVAEVKAKQK